jgi:hypothetical protein
LKDQEIMSTIPASALVSVIPGVLNAGGNALELIGLQVTKSTRVPIGTVPSFTSAAAVAAFFGAASHQAAVAAVYFKGYSTATAYPAALLFAQFPSAGVPAYLQSGNVASLGLAAIQALTGTLTVVMDGYTFTDGSLSLSGATSFSSAAGLIQTGLNTALPTEASVTGAIAPATASVTASVAGNVMTATGGLTGSLVPGAALSGTGVTANTVINSQLSGTPGGLGTYAVSIAQTVAATSIAAAYGVLTVSAVASGTLSAGQTISDSGITTGTQITSQLTGTAGGDGTYAVNISQTVVSESAILAKPMPLVVTFDSVSGSFFITSGIIGSASSAAFATGSLAASLLLTSATGAVLSQGASAELPGVFMNSIIAQTQDWATFYTDFNPDGGSGNAQKQLFAAWVNSTTDQFAYVCWDTDITPTLNNDATASLGQILAANQSNGTILVYQPSDLYGAPFVSGMIASINFNATNGRITLFGKGQSGLVAGVTNAQVAANLIANNYNYVGAYATAATGFVIFNPGSISGEFLWANTYVNQIWLNAALQLALMELLTTVNSVPFNADGISLVYGSLQTPIAAGINFGAIRAGVTLSSAQIAEVNNAAGFDIATTIQQVGWYLLIQISSPQVRAARGPLAITFFYCDGGDVQTIALNSTEIQ